MSDKLYDILIVSPHKAFVARRKEKDKVIFVDHWETDENTHIVISCKSESDRAKLLTIMKRLS